MKNGREPRRHGVEKKELNVVAKIRGLGKVTVVSSHKPQHCKVSGILTTIGLKVVSTGHQISCHSAHIRKGIALLKTSFA
ncbi:hypothetical protein HGA34_03665 [Candidatus Falkowbacteria bacterium]|nr:hypothetical protein [Candidatus Falkowbacteria bacterium]